MTYLLRRAGEARLVLRRPPRPPLPPSAHDVLREARLLRAIEGADVRTPRVLAACDDDSVLGVPFYVMERIEGTVITNEVPPALDEPDERRLIGEELVDALVEMHAVDWRASGLEGFGKPTGYLERQLRRFGGLWEHNKTRELPLVQEVGEWLARNMPESPDATIVHGDYRLGNTMFRNEAPARLVAIFDWEMATIGDPLADLGYLTATWSRPDGMRETMFDRMSVTHADGFPSRDDLVARYEEAPGARCPTFAGTRRWRSGRPRCSWRATTSARWPGPPTTPGSRCSTRASPSLAEAARQLTEMPAPRT